MQKSLDQTFGSHNKMQAITALELQLTPTNNGVETMIKEKPIKRSITSTSYERLKTKKEANKHIDENAGLLEKRLGQLRIVRSIHTKI